MEEIPKEAFNSPALRNRHNSDDEFNYPAYFNNKVPLKVIVHRTVRADMPFLAKADTVCAAGKEYYVWVNSYGAISAILDNGERLGLKPNEFTVTEYHS